MNVLIPTLRSNMATKIQMSGIYIKNDNLSLEMALICSYIKAPTLFLSLDIIMLDCSPYVSVYEVDEYMPYLHIQ